MARGTKRQIAKVDAPKQADINELIKNGATQLAVNAPSAYATTTRITAQRTNVNIVFSKLHPVEFRVGNEAVYAATNTPVFILDMSAESAKDLQLLLEQQLGIIEQAFGPIQTDFTRRLEAEAAEKKAKPSKPVRVPRGVTKQ